MSKRIVLLTTGSTVASAMAQRMATIRDQLVLIVEERAPRSFKYSPLSEFARHLVGDNIMNVLGRMKQPAHVKRTVRWETRKKNAADAHINDWLKANGVLPQWPSGIDVFTTPAINNEATLARLREAQPDLLVVFGTKLLKPPLIGIAPMGAVNAHSSLLPAYRGLRSEFWQCYNNDPSAVGLTIHVVDPEVDTGNILQAIPTRTPWPTDPYALRALNVISALEHYPEVVQQHLDGLTRPMPQQASDQPTNRGKDITLEKRMELIERLGRG